MSDANDTAAGSAPPANPTLGRKAGYNLDEHGNVTGIWFEVESDHLIEFTDHAVNFTAKSVGPDQPAA